MKLVFALIRGAGLSCGWSKKIIFKIGMEQCNSAVKPVVMQGGIQPA